MKRALERERKANKYLQCTGELWEEERSRLRKALNDAMVRVEGVAPAPLQTPSSSVSRNGAAPLKPVSRIRYRERKRLKTVIVPNELFLWLSYYVYMFLKLYKFCSALCIRAQSLALAQVYFFEAMVTQ